MVFILTWIIFWTIALNPPINSVGGVSLNPPINSLGGRPVSPIEVYNPHTTLWSALNQSNGNYTYSITHNEVLSLRIYVSYTTTISNVSITVSNDGSIASPVAINYFNNYAYFNESVVPSTYVFNIDATIHGTSYLSLIKLQIFGT
jgi:hypothetical protein